MSIPLFKVSMSEQASEAVAKVLESGMTGEGPVVQKFENKLQEYFGVHTIALNSCTSALILALRMSNVEGKKVLVSPFTFPATSCAVAAERGCIEWVAPEEDTLCMDLEVAARKVKDNPKGIAAVVVTLVGGHVPYGLLEFQQLLSKHRISLIFDAAHAFGTFVYDRHVANHADFSCFSFQSIKHLTTGDGGALTIRDPWQVDRAERLKWFGMSRDTKGKTRLQHQMDYSIPEWGYKFHMNDIAASIGLANWETAWEGINASQGNAAFYDAAFSEEVWIRPLKSHWGYLPAYWVYGFHIPVSYQMELIDRLNKNGVDASPLWKPNNEHECFSSSYSNVRTFSPVFIPNGWWVTASDRESIVDQIKKYMREKNL